MAARCGFAGLHREVDKELAVGDFIDSPPEQTVEAIQRLKAFGAPGGFLISPATAATYGKP